jgi:drug/metabolite transporter (DMT)-like permease
MNATTPSQHHRFAFPALLLANLILAFGPWLVRLSDVGPVAAGFWRLLLAAPILLLLAGPGRLRSLGDNRLILVGLVLGGLFFAADLASWHIGIFYTKLANATLFGNVSSLLFPLYGFILLRSWPHPLQAVALGAAAVGIVLLLGGSYELSPEHLTGDLAALLAGLFYTFYLIAIDRARRTLGAMPVLALSTVAGIPLLLIFSLALGETVISQSWWPLILLSLGSQLIGQGLLVYSIGHISPVVVGIVFLTQPVVSAVIGWAAYGERLQVGDVAGALLICIAIVLIRWPGRLESARPRAHLPSDGEPNDAAAG